MRTFKYQSQTLNALLLKIQHLTSYCVLNCLQVFTFSLLLVTFHSFLSTLRLPFWHQKMKTLFMTEKQLEQTTECLISLLQLAVRFCCVHVSQGQHHTLNLCLSVYFVCWWGRSSGWQGPFLQTPLSSKVKYKLYSI